ncbi:MAG: MerR family transcriptional regulator [Rhodobacteraceae bacterium]|nr:MerR family transcriptional regulator [Paracoccaceae bacterium]
MADNTSDKSADAFRTISEVANWLGVQTHVLRFWESKFTQIKPVKRAGGRRYYRQADMELIGGIKILLHDNGMTIRGVQKILREQGVAAVTKFAPGVDGDDAPMAVDVMPTDNVVPLKPAPRKAAKPKPAPAPTAAQDDLPLEAPSPAEAPTQAPDTAPEPVGEAPAPDAEAETDDAQAKLVALRNRLAALRDRSAGS